MRLRLLLLLFFGFSLMPAFAGKLPAYQIFTAQGKPVDFQKMVKSTTDKNYIFFGEYHNNSISHWLELEFTKALYDVYKKRLVLGAEMFEADNQFIIDEYLNDWISAKNFQNEVRLWPNYNTDYKALVEFAKANKLPFIATNIPRRYANMVYKKGTESLDLLSDQAKSYMVPPAQFKFDPTVDCYADLIESMGDHGGESLAKAQAIKDATMAYFIAKNANEKRVFLHYNGAYHSDRYQGIIHYLKNSVDIDKIMTITTVTQADVNQLDEANKALADFIICVPETMTTTH